MNFTLPLLVLDKTNLKYQSEEHTHSYCKHANLTRQKINKHASIFMESPDSKSSVK